MTKADEPFVTPFEARNALMRLGRGDIDVLDELAIDGLGVVPIVCCRVRILQSAHGVYMAPRKVIGGIAVQVGPPKLVGMVADPEIIEGEFIGERKGARINIDALWWFPVDESKPGQWIVTRWSIEA